MADKPLDTSTWGPAMDAVTAAPKHHKVLFENERLRVLELTLEPNDEEPIHHHRWPSVFVFDQVQVQYTTLLQMGLNYRRTETSCELFRLERARLFSRGHGPATTRAGS